jgi:hypothetical protein
MQNASFRRTVFLLLLFTVLAAPWAWAAGGRPDADRPAETASSPLHLLDRLWTFLKSAWSEEGCMIDPDGRCVPAPQPQGDSGCMIDPDGRCRA